VLINAFGLKREEVTDRRMEISGTEKLHSLHFLPNINTFIISRTLLVLVCSMHGGITNPYSI
jgi:hypothetical protein